MIYLSINVQVSALKYGAFPLKNDDFRLKNDAFICIKRAGRIEKACKVSVTGCALCSINICIKLDELSIKMMNSVLKMMNSVLKMMNSVLKMMNSVLKMMNPVLKMMNSVLKMMNTGRHGLYMPGLNDCRHFVCTALRFLYPLCILHKHGRFFATFSPKAGEF